MVSLSKKCCSCSPSFIDNCYVEDGYLSDGGGEIKKYDLLQVLGSLWFYLFHSVSEAMEVCQNG